MSNSNILETKRLILRKLTRDDQGDLAEIFYDDQVMKFFGGSLSPAENKAGLQKQLDHYQQYGFGRFAVLKKDEKEAEKVIGICGPQWWEDVNGRYLELGYFFNKNYWHHGFASEAARACCQYCFNQLAISELSSIVESHNLSSMNVAIRVGMTVKDWYLRDDHGQEHLHYRFSIVNNSPNNN